MDKTTKKYVAWVDRFLKSDSIDDKQLFDELIGIIMYFLKVEGKMSIDEVMDLINTSVKFKRSVVTKDELQNLIRNNLKLFKNDIEKKDFSHLIYTCSYLYLYFHY